MRTLPEIGLMYDFRLMPRQAGSWSDLARSTLDVCEELDAAGVDGIWLTEHHFTDDSYLPALLPMAAALAMRTQQCTIGTSVLLAPLHHPLAIAEASSVVDNLAEGRLILGLGLGYRAEELAAFGIAKKERGRRLDETIEILRQAWSPEAVEFDGDFFQLSGVSVQPKPVQERPRLWLAARSEIPAQRAGRVADGVIIAGDLALAGTVRDAAVAAGRKGSDVKVACLRSLVVADRMSATDSSQVFEALEHRSSRYQRWYGAAADLPEDRAFTSAGTATEDFAVRSLEEELSQMRDLAAQGVDHVIYHGSAPGVDPRVYLPQWLELLAAVRDEGARQGNLDGTRA